MKETVLLVFSPSSANSNALISGVSAYARQRKWRIHMIDRADRKTLTDSPRSIPGVDSPSRGLETSGIERDKPSPLYLTFRWFRNSLKREALCSEVIGVASRWRSPCSPRAHLRTQASHILS